MNTKVQFEVEGFQFVFINPNKIPVPPTNSHSKVLQAFAGTMIEQLTQVLIESGKKRINPLNVKLYYDEQCVFE